MGSIVADVPGIPWDYMSRADNIKIFAGTSKTSKIGTNTTLLNDLHLLYSIKEYKVQYKRSLMSGRQIN